MQRGQVDVRHLHHRRDQGAAGRQEQDRVLANVSALQRLPRLSLDREASLSGAAAAAQRRLATRQELSHQSQRRVPRAPPLRAQQVLAAPDQPVRARQPSQARAAAAQVPRESTLGESVGDGGRHGGNGQAKHELVQAEGRLATRAHDQLGELVPGEHQERARQRLRHGQGLLRQPHHSRIR